MFRLYKLLKWVFGKCPIHNQAIGFNTFTEYPTNFLSLSGANKFSWVRLDAKFGKTQNEIDTAISAFIAAGVIVCALVSVNEWNDNGAEAEYLIDNSPAKILEWDNEIDLNGGPIGTNVTTLKSYIVIWKRLFERNLKRGKKAKYVLGPSVSTLHYGPTGAGQVTLKNLVANGIGNCCHALPIHVYVQDPTCNWSTDLTEVTSVATLKTNIKEQITIARKICGNIKIIVTEMGFPTKLVEHIFGSYSDANAASLYQAGVEACQEVGVPCILYSGLYVDNTFGCFDANEVYQQSTDKNMDIFKFVNGSWDGGSPAYTGMANALMGNVQSPV